MKTKLIFMSLLSLFLLFSDCDFGMPDISIPGGSSGYYGPPKVGFNIDTLNNVRINLDTIIQVNDTLVNITLL